MSANDVYLSLSSSQLFALSFTAIVGLSLLTFRWSKTARRLPYPPGPKPLPVLGNLLDIPTTTPWKTYAEMGKGYQSGITHISALGQHIVIVNSREDAIQIFDKRAEIYSDRPFVPMLEFMGWMEFNSAMFPYGDLWRRHRRVLQQSFNKHSVVNYHDILTNKICDMLRGFLATPENFGAHYRTLPGAIIMAIVYGHDVALTDDHFVNLAEEAVKAACEATLPGTFAVNHFPILHHLPPWMPGGGFWRTAEEIKKMSENMSNIPFNFVRKNMASGTGNPSLLADLLEDNDASGGSKDQEEIVKGVAAMAYGAASDTSAAAIGNFILAMTKYPEVQKRAQEQLTSVVGSGRLPTLKDRDSLPFIEALYREVMRWKPALPLSIPHAASADDVHQGWFIPKGAIVIGNVWAMAHDEAVYPDPEQFSPDRFVNKDGSLNDDDPILTYGFGRRVCVGKHLASASVWLTIALVLATFDISKAKDGSGKDIEVVEECTDGIVSHPKPFKCRIVPRSLEARKLIEESGI